ncbi:polysaccharide pyruvyl transferase family protein [Pseudochrobactrum kiredjianiae]|uniref:Polysaccharide pyruvyl transferase family protein n=1 Tax=Pseudochrobactrum kiredjianiae TaxID=386305 RepID=A0ABW3UY65_9HYPH|nr:polysaccharide pyruvyl transferase family protein [Pseudochrobactrum kiredjianiae]MDM7852515.1 polysaccharide pyruvyl transferase family protein [Pseudochrobactrum kiredjianiae]
MGKIFRSTNDVALGEIYSRNVGDGIICECLRLGLAEREVKIFPADLSRSDGYSVPEKNSAPTNLGASRKFARYFVRPSLFLRRIITFTKWIFGGRRNSINKYKDIFGSSDGVIIGGGQSLVDRQLYFPLAIEAILKMARNSRNPVAVFSCGADAKQGWIPQRICLKMAREAVYICVRDNTSAEMFQNLDKKLRIDVRPDIGFLAGNLYNQVETMHKKILGINLMPYETVAALPEGVKIISRANYIAFWRALIQNAVFQGWTFHILINGDVTDLIAAKEVYEASGMNERFFIAASPTTPSELVDMLQNIDILITSRMYAGIVVYSLGTKVVPLIWDKKVSGIWREADINVKPISFNELFDANVSFNSSLVYILKDVNTDCVQQAKVQNKIRARINESLDNLAKCFIRKDLNQDISVTIS